MPFNVYSYPKFGDHCVSYGIVKEFAKKHDKIHYWSDWMPSNMFNTNKRLFSGIKNVEFIPEPYNEKKLKADHCIANTPIWHVKVLGDKWDWGEDGTNAPGWFNDYWVFDRQWYMNADVPFNLKWDNFDFQRDFKKEREVYYDVLGLKDGEEFIFLHEDISRYKPINRSYVTPNIKILEFSTLPVNILDILYTVEKAKEVHIFNSGLLSFIDLMNIKHIKLNYHKYVRPAVLDQPALRLNWKIIEK